MHDLLRQRISNDGAPWDTGISTRGDAPSPETATMKAATILHRDNLPESIRHYYPAAKPWILDRGPKHNWQVFPTREQAEQAAATA